MHNMNFKKFTIILKGGNNNNNNIDVTKKF